MSKTVRSMYNSNYVGILKMKCSKTFAINNNPINSIYLTFARESGRKRKKRKKTQNEKTNTSSSINK